MCIGVRPPTLQTLMKGGYTAPKLTIVAVGSKPPIAAFEVGVMSACSSKTRACFSRASTSVQCSLRMTKPAGRLVHEVEEHTQRGAIAMVSDIAQSLKGWIPSPMRRVKEVKRQASRPFAGTSTAGYRMTAGQHDSSDPRSENTHCLPVRSQPSRRRCRQRSRMTRPVPSPRWCWHPGKPDRRQSKPLSNMTICPAL